MIPPAFLAAWARRAPWPTQTQIEQDLILSRFMVEIANHAVLGPELALRGGTCLHKLHLPKPLRYSEDLDYVRRTRTGVGEYIDALREIATAIGLTEHGREQTRSMVHVIFDAEPASGLGRIRIKVEANIQEVDSAEERASIPYSVESQWWSGSAAVSTFSIEELMATKLRALYQRRKGRDLFDLWLVLTQLQVDDARIVRALRHYMGGEVFRYADLATNLRNKLTNEEFTGDLEQLVATAPAQYLPEAAADLVIERLATELDGAPDAAALVDGAWRL